MAPSGRSGADLRVLAAVGAELARARGLDRPGHRRAIRAGCGGGGPSARARRTHPGHPTGDRAPTLDSDPAVARQRGKGRAPAPRDPHHAGHRGVVPHRLRHRSAPTAPLDAPSPGRDRRAARHRRTRLPVRGRRDRRHARTSWRGGAIGRARLDGDGAVAHPLDARWPGLRRLRAAELRTASWVRAHVLLYPNGLLLRGSGRQTAWAHGLLVEALTDAPAYQTFDPVAQDIERQIRGVWAVFGQNPAAHVGAAALDSRLDEIAEQIRALPVGYEEWQIVYRQALQLDRALRGRPQLLEARTSIDPRTRSPEEEIAMTNGATRSLSLRELLGEITGKVTLLARKEVELARTELKADLASEVAAGKGLLVAALVGILGINMFLVAAVFALAAYMPAWLAAVLIGIVLVVIAGILGYVSWSRRVTSPLSTTWKTLKEDALWAKERLA